MKNRTVAINDLTPGKVFLVRGKLLFSRLASQVEGDELVKNNERRRARGAMPISRAYTEATICDAEVQHQVEGQCTPEETYAEESLYESKQEKYPGKNYSITNKTKQLPYIVVKREGEDIADRIELEGELASGLDVTLVMRVFKSTSNHGISLDGVILNEPVRYRGNDAAFNDFKTLNIAELALGRVG